MDAVHLSDTLIAICHRRHTTHVLLEHFISGIRVTFGRTLHNFERSFIPTGAAPRIYHPDTHFVVLGIHDGVGWNPAVLKDFIRFLEQEELANE